LDDTAKGNGELLEEIGALRAQIADLGRSQDLLRESESRFRKIFEHSNDAILLVEPEEDAILDVNIKACNLLGYSRPELLSVPMSAIHPHEMERLQAFAQAVYATGEGWTDELTCLTKAGGTIPTEISASLMEYAGSTCMVAIVRDMTDRDRLARRNEYLHDELQAEFGHGAIVGQTPAHAKVLEQIEMVAKTGASVLLTGESGTGKELVASAIHQNSDRRDAAFVRVNCPSIPAEIFESEFFGHVKGAFTGALHDRVGRFELADGGTLLLDEIGEIPLALQSKLLRVLQEGEFQRIGEARTRKVDVRIIAATNRDLLAASREGLFRQDLYYRLSVFPIELPPLRERRDDIGLLAQHFVEQSSNRLGVPPGLLTQSDIRLLERYDWPGNARELQNVIERAVILFRGGRFQFHLGQVPQSLSIGQTQQGLPVTERMTLADLPAMEREILVGALERSDWKIYGPDGAAEAVGLPPTSLAYRIKKLGIVRPTS